ncbi:MAG: Crp/Fnr family transcriptional regulator [Gammaproteobacteria bacterium]|nr:Crp/Fnr family transcriptional regulator [Gammaproteobacteria bacterium]
MTVFFRKTADTVKPAGLFPELDQAGWWRLFGDASPAQIAKGSRIFSPGDPCSNFLIVLEGSVKVVQLSETGREIVLYRVQNNESCLLTTACLLANENYTVSAIAETDVHALTLPAEAFARSMENSADMRRFVFNDYSRRMADFFVLIRELAFETLDVRLAHRLLQQAGDADSLSITHQALADELGTTREVVSRRLKEFEQLGWIQLHRGRIELSNRTALEDNR